VTVATSTAALEVEVLDLGAGLIVSKPDGLESVGGTVVRVRWHAREDGTGIARAFLSPPAAAPCTAGLVARAIDVDGQTRWDRPVGLGREHVVAFGFPWDDRVTAEPLVLDVDVRGAGGPACVRLPLTGGGTRYVARSNFVAGAAAGLEVGLRAHGGGALFFDGIVGRWAGPLRFTVRAGLGAGVGSRVASGDDDSSLNSSPKWVDLHLAPELSILPFVWGSRAIGITASYVVATATSGSGTVADPERDTDFMGPRLAVVLAHVLPPPLGASAHRAADAVGLELSLLRASAWPSGSGGVTYVLGLGVLFW
jgi:hypothetical protein